jgi:peptidyl-prolyl cis-trans isomerase SurA
MRLTPFRAAAAALAVVLAPAALARPAAAQAAPAPATRPAARPAAAGGAARSAVRSVDVDRVVAVVGTTPILYSDLLDELNMRRAYGLQLPTDSAGRAKVERDVLGEMVDAELLVQKAKEEKVEVSDEEIGKQVDDNLKQIRAQYPSENEYRAALRTNGFGTPEDYRKRQVEMLRRRNMQQEVYQKLRKDQKLAVSSVSDQELNDAYSQSKASFPKREAMVTFKQIIVAPKPTPKAKAAARAKAESLLVQIGKGADFAELAKKHSQDPGSGAQGGDLGWNRRGAMVKEFDEMMFALPVGRVSPIVETPFGYHIIKVDRAQPAEVKARHILIIPARDTTDVRRARVEADSVRLALGKGADFDSVAARHHDSQEFRALPDIPRDSLPPAYRTALASAGKGALVGPFPIDDPRSGLQKFVVVRVTQATAEGEYPEADIKARLREQVSEGKTMRKLVDSLRRATYVSMRL